jgi:hypothetical protein
MLVSSRRRPLAALVLALVAAVAAALLATGAVGAAADGRAPAPDTIVRITGNPAEGFGIEHYDGSSTFPPTNTEALAECREYPAAVGRARCRVKVKTWYRDLVETKKALRYARRA